MGENSIIGSKIFLIDSFKHPSFCLGSYNSMTRKTDVSKVINSAGVCFENQFLGMYCKMQLMVKKSLNLLKTINQRLFLFTQKHEIVGVSHIPLYSQPILNKLI